MPAIDREGMLSILAKGATTKVANPQSEPRFIVGARVIARNLNPYSHTRLPRYVRGRKGTIAVVHGVFALPDSNAIGAGHNAQYCYSVCFEATELWGPQGRAGDCIYIDLWDDYLDPA
ncbi:MAG: nitrile hydratase subunit beta [Acidiferrobacterales bacterium]|nr:nitrile hydratase subunit beta [Acidiferrobacterales bacterium]